MASTDARPVPIKNTAYRVVFPILDADGDLVTGAAGLDSEVSKDQGTFADCTNEATEIATSSGMYYLDLTSTEMNADCVAVIVKTSTSGAKTTPIVLYPQESGDIKVDVQSYGGTAGTFSGGRPEVNTTHIAGSAVSTSSAQIGVNVVNFGGSAGTFASGRPEVNTTHAAGTAWGSGAITAASIASSAIADTKIATGAITSAKFAAGAIDATAIADNAIDLATFAADAKALFGVIAFGTAQSVTGTTIQLASSETFADDELIGATVLIRSATTGAGQSRVITDYVSATDTATVDTWTTTPTGTITYVVFGTAPASTSSPLAVNVTQFGGVAITSASGIPEVKVASIAANAITATAIASDAITAAKVADGTIDAATFAAGAINAAAIATGAIDADALAADAVAEIADGVWDEATSGHSTAGSTGKALTDASSAGDPWSTALPGAYGAGTAGYLIGTNLDATVSSRLATSGYTAPLSAAGTRTALGLASANLDTQLGDLPTAVENADALLARNVAGGSDGTRTVSQAFYVLRNKVAISAGTLTVYGTDDSTPAFTASVTTAAGDPVSAIDPA